MYGTVFQYPLRCRVTFRLLSQDVKNITSRTNRIILIVLTDICLVIEY